MSSKHGDFEMQTKYYTDKHKYLKTAIRNYNFTNNLFPDYNCKLIQFIELCPGIKIGIDISNNK